MFDDACHRLARLLCKTYQRCDGTDIPASTLHRLNGQCAAIALAYNQRVQDVRALIQQDAYSMLHAAARPAGTALH